jgi:cyclophilin family peptidyl-prolyl cis-trans isomerase
MRWLAALCALGVSASALAGTLVQFRTAFGDLDVELLDLEKPVTVQNFIRLLESGAYQNTFFHRCVPGFVVQGGGFWVANPASTNNVASVFAAPNFGPISNEFAVGATYSNVFGTLAMAKTASGPDTATSQWFFNLANNATNLGNQNGGFTVFGRVLGPTNALQVFNRLALNAGILKLDNSTFSAVPVLYAGSAYPRYVDLVYVDITLLSVAISDAPSGASSISWNSAPGLTNVVEYTEALTAPDWHELHRTNGNGTRLAFTDTNSTPSRFYRVRIDR